eukprot:PhF_6_TR6091/c0_g1_i2/m.8918/K13280/SEC11, sipW; signal peptidase, endoplasmic reticulum-type
MFGPLQHHVNTLRSMKFREYISQSVSLGLVVCSALIIWKSLMFFTYSESPIVVVLSDSMEPLFYRGDLLFLTLFPNEPVRAGDVVVFRVDGRDIPIVHRVLRVHKESPEGFYLLTKGDNNYVDDRGLYVPGQLYLEKRNLMGKAVGYLPSLGMVAILMNDFPELKWMLIGGLALFVITSRE